MNHRRLMVSFKVEVVALSKLRLDECRRKTKVGAKSQFEVCSPDGESDRIESVVLDTEGVDLQIPEFERLACREDSKFGAIMEGVDDPLGGFLVSEDGDAHLIGKDLKALDMVCVLVSNENRVNIGDIYIDFRETVLDSARADASIDENFIFSCSKVDAVPFRARGKWTEAFH